MTFTDFRHPEEARKRRLEGRTHAHPALKTQPGFEYQLGIEIKLGVERALDVFGAAEAVLLPGEQQVAAGNAAAAQRVDHHLGLVGRHDAVLAALKEDHWAIEPVDMR